MIDELFSLLKTKAERLPEGEVVKILGPGCQFGYRFGEGFETVGIWFDEEMLRGVSLDRLADRIIEGLVLAIEEEDDKDRYLDGAAFDARLLRDIGKGEV